MQTPKTRARLMRRWGGAPILGSVGVWDLLHLLHFTIDHTDTVLRYTSLYYAHPIPSYSTRTAATYTVLRYTSLYYGHPRAAVQLPCRCRCGY